MTLVPDKYYLYVSPGEDTALLSALGALVDGTQSRIHSSIPGIDQEIAGRWR
jgi:formylmethanofuran dehydrogenase subunit B